MGGSVAAADEAGGGRRGAQYRQPWPRRRGRVHSGRRGWRRRRGARAEPDRRRPGGAQGVRGSRVRVQLRRDPRALLHAPGSRALLLHEPTLPRRPPPPPAADALAVDSQLEDLQPRRQPGRGEGPAQVLGAGRRVHRQALQLNTNAAMVITQPRRHGQPSQEHEQHHKPCQEHDRFALLQSAARMIDGWMGNAVKIIVVGSCWGRGGEPDQLVAVCVTVHAVESVVQIGWE